MQRPPKREIVATYALGLSVSLTQEEEDALQAEFQRAKSMIPTMGDYEPTEHSYLELAALMALRKEIERMVKAHKKEKERQAA